MALDRSANEDPVPEAIKADIVRGIWHRSFVTDSPADLRRWGAILTYYTAECKKAISYSRGEYTTVRTHKDIIAIVHMLENGCSKDKIAQSLFPLDTQQRSDQAKLHMVEGSLRLAARLMSMVDVGPLPHSVQGWAPAIWSNGASTLEVVLADYFRESTTTVVTGTKFSEDFTAFNFQKLAGLQIRWTNNLAHHLRLMDNDTTLCLFHHACFLKYQDSSVLPPGLADETLRTIAMLFPRNDRNTRNWILSECSSAKNAIHLDMEILSCDRIMGEQRRAEAYMFWRDELLTLKELFDQPRPTSIAQFWYDRRNKAQWYTFWIAVLILCLTIFFGLIQSIEGALQVYKAYHPTSA